MYATALKTIKEQFGQLGNTARACITKLIDKPKIQNSDRQLLQELSFDVVNCVATLKQIDRLADVNATDNLRKIIMRLPDHLIQKWKDFMSDLSEKGKSPSLEHIGKFIRRCVKAEFYPDFWDICISNSRKPSQDRDPPTPPLSLATPALDSDSIMPVVTVKFRSANGRVREGNILINSGGGTMVIRKEFARDLGLQGQQERIDIAVVGGERLSQSNSRRVKVWISTLNGKETFPIEAHELDHTIINVPSLERTWLK